jgi:hypothetical protein
MKAVTVCVNYDDLLSIALSANVRHFEKTLIVSSPDDAATHDLVNSLPGVELFITDAFYRNGARFNKGAALEESFDVLGRDGWILVWDADIVLPEVLPVDESQLNPEWLYGCHRRIMADPCDWFKDPPPAWDSYPRRKEFELAGYFHLFHASASSLKRPWYGIDWMHAGGCDSVFQEQFPADKKIRLDFDALHLGEPDVNWLGRATKRTDGTVPDNAEELRSKLHQMLKTRRKFGKHDNRRYVHEKVKTAAPVAQQTVAKRK